MEQYRRGRRADLARQEEAEIEILREFLPEPLSPEELESLVRRTILDAGATGKAQLGAIIKAVLQQAGGRTDGRRIREVADRLLKAQGS